MWRRNPVGILAGLGFAALAASNAAAIYMRVDAQKVPVERLVANLERKAAQEPRNALHQVNLGRLHGMAFALKTEEVPAVKKPGTNEEEVWFGYEAKLIPYPNRGGRRGGKGAPHQSDRALRKGPRARSREPAWPAGIWLDARTGGGQEQSRRTVPAGDRAGLEE
jgi:hypothetical protein